MTKFLTAAVLTAAATAAFAHPGHPDQSIHLAEWLMGAGTFGVALALVVRQLRKHRADR